MCENCFLFMNINMSSFDHLGVSDLHQVLLADDDPFMGALSTEDPTCYAEEDSPFSWNELSHSTPNDSSLMSCIANLETLKEEKCFKSKDGKRRRKQTSTRKQNKARPLYMEDPTDPHLSEREKKRIFQSVKCKSQRDRVHARIEQLEQENLEQRQTIEELIEQIRRLNEEREIKHASEVCVKAKGECQHYPTQYFTFTQLQT